MTIMSAYGEEREVLAIFDKLAETLATALRALENEVDERRGHACSEGCAYDEWVEAGA